MKPYAPTLEDVTDEVPFVPEDFRDCIGSTFTHEETLDAIEAPYTYELDYLPARFPVPVVTVDGVLRTVVPYNEEAVPAEGQVAISFDAPIIQFAAADVGALEYQVNYTAIGSVPTARFFNKIQRALARNEAGTVTILNAATSAVQAVTGLVAGDLVAVCYQTADNGGGALWAVADTDSFTVKCSAAVAADTLVNWRVIH